MFKILMTLARGRSQDAATCMMDANALSILRQQLRDAAVDVEKSRKALAVVMAYESREKANLAKQQEQISKLETRAMAALEKNMEALATEAANAIAALENDAAATRKTIETYGPEIARLRAALKNSEAQLAELKRGQRLAEANDKAIKLRGAYQDASQPDLQSATETLKRVQARQSHAHDTAKALYELSTHTHAETLEDRLAEAGCGVPKKSDGAAVLKRLKAAQGSENISKPTSKTSSERKKK